MCQPTWDSLPTVASPHFVTKMPKGQCDLVVAVKMVWNTPCLWLQGFTSHSTNVRSESVAGQLPRKNPHCSGRTGPLRPTSPVITTEGQCKFAAF